ncbi:MAG TPA: C45 family peptidase [Thermomicrobiales bacterium]|nr:C45 family peptidase [Thermomicrobiales bacterium]
MTVHALTESIRVVPGCTIAAATGSATADGRPLLMATSDDPFATRTRLVVDEGAARRFLATQIVSPPPMVSWSNMHTRGVNDAGFAYVWSYVTPADEPNDETAIGIPYYQFGRLVLAEATRIDDALDLLDRHPRAFHGNFLFADASGEICLVEVGTRSLHVAERTRDGAIGRTNHWTSERGRSVEDAALACSSRHRYERVNALLTDAWGRIDREMLMAICRDHAGRGEPAVGYSICAHGRPEQGDAWFGTVSSEVIEPATRTLWYCYGWPCGEAPDDPARQPYQAHSWGAYLRFDLDRMASGVQVTTDGRLTAGGWRYLASLASREAATALA